MHGREITFRKLRTFGGMSRKRYEWNGHMAEVTHIKGHDHCDVVEGNKLIGGRRAKIAAGKGQHGRIVKLLNQWWDIKSQEKQP